MCVTGGKGDLKIHRHIKSFFYRLLSLITRPDTKPKMDPCDTVEKAVQSINASSSQPLLFIAIVIFNLNHFKIKC